MAIEDKRRQGNPMPQQRSFIHRVSEIVLNVRDIERMSWFYQDVLGFELHSRFPETNPTIVFLTISDHDSALSRGGHPQLLALIDPVRHGPAEQRFDEIERRRSTLNHIAFEIDLADYGPQKQRFAELGLNPSTEEFAFLGARALFFEDPEGNLLELLCHDASLVSPQY